MGAATIVPEIVLTSRGKYSNIQVLNSFCIFYFSFSFVIDFNC